MIMILVGVGAMAIASWSATMWLRGVNNVYLSDMQRAITIAAGMNAASMFVLGAHTLWTHL